MNRREAIQKIAAGGAVAAGASVVLSSNDVAHAASPPDTGLTNVPAQFEPLPIVFTPNSNGTVTIDASSNASCASGGAPTVTYSWKVNSVSFGGRRQRRNRSRLVVRNESRRRQVVHNTRSATGYSAASTALTAIRLEKTTGGRNARRQPLRSSDSYNLSVIVSWQCAGANSALEAEYTISGAGQSAPSVSNVAYNVF